MIRRPPRSTLFPTRRSSDLHRPPRPVALRRERAADDDRRLALEPGPDEQHRAAVAVDDRAEVHRGAARSEEHTSELQSRPHLVCRLLLEKKKKCPDVIENEL